MLPCLCCLCPSRLSQIPVGLGLGDGHRHGEVPDRASPPGRLHSRCPRPSASEERVQETLRRRPPRRRSSGKGARPRPGWAAAGEAGRRPSRPPRRPEQIHASGPYEQPSSAASTCAALRAKEGGAAPTDRSSRGAPPRWPGAAADHRVGPEWRDRRCPRRERHVVRLGPRRDDPVGLRSAVERGRARPGRGADSPTQRRFTCRDFAAGGP